MDEPRDGDLSTVEERIEALARRHDPTWRARENAAVLDAAADLSRLLDVLNDRLMRACRTGDAEAARRILSGPLDAAARGTLSRLEAHVDEVDEVESALCNVPPRVVLRGTATLTRAEGERLLDEGAKAREELVRSRRRVPRWPENSDAE